MLGLRLLVSLQILKKRQKKKRERRKKEENMYSEAAFSKLPGLGGISSRRLRLAAGAGSLLAAREHHGLSCQTEGEQQQDKLLCSMSPQLPTRGKSFMRLCMARSESH